MIIEQARVVHVSGEWVTLETAVTSTCSSCSAQEGCGTGTVAKAFAGKTQRIEVKSTAPLNVGDVVTLGIPEKRILLVSSLLYLFPLFSFMVSALLGHLWFGSSANQNEWPILAFSLVTTFLSLLLLSRRIKRWDKGHFEPVILTNLASSVG